MGIPCTWIGATGDPQFAPVLCKKSYLNTHIAILICYTNQGDEQIHITDACTEQLVVLV